MSPNPRPDRQDPRPRRRGGRRCRRLLALGLAAGLLASTAVVAWADTHRVRATARDRWDPKHLYITQGDRVVWRNPDSQDHDVTAYRGWTFRERLSPDERVGRRFNDVGTFRYRCRLHSAMVDGACRGMCGLIHVFEP